MQTRCRRIRRSCLESAAAWSSGVCCARWTAGRPSQRCAPDTILKRNIQSIKYNRYFARNIFDKLDVSPLPIRRWCSSLRSFWRRRSWECGGSQTGCQSSPEHNTILPHPSHWMQFLNGNTHSDVKYCLTYVLVKNYLVFGNCFSQKHISLSK